MDPVGAPGSEPAHRDDTQRHPALLASRNSGPRQYSRVGKKVQTIKNLSTTHLLVLSAACAMPLRSRSLLRRNRAAAFYDIERSGHTLIDSRQRMEEHPSTWQAAGWYEISAVGPGDLVKVGLQYSSDSGLGGERFWTIVQEVEGDVLRAEVNNNLLAADSPRCGEIIEFRRRHIIGVLSAPRKEG